MAEYLENCWYPFAWSEELGEKQFARTILGRKIVAFRNANGEPAALLDKCPHRFAPLSMGEVKNGNVHCAYHGLAFSGDGTCVHNPFGPPPANAHVRSFPIVERDRLLWIWPGEAALADPAKIPNFSFHTEKNDEDWVVQGYTHMKTEYQIETDNLMDLSHAETLHRSTFGGRGNIYRGQFELRDLGDEIHSNWWMPNIPVQDPATGAEVGINADSFLDMRWSLPSAMRLHISFMPAGSYSGREKTLREDIPGQFTAHILTPETETTTHYFWSSNRPTDMNAGMTKEAGRALLLVAFEQEDKVMLEAVQENMDGEFWSNKPLLLRTDGGGVLARRRVAKLIAEEKHNASREPEPQDRFES